MTASATPPLYKFGLLSPAETLLLTLSTSLRTTELLELLEIFPLSKHIELILFNYIQL